MLSIAFDKYVYGNQTQLPKENPATLQRMQEIDRYK